MLNFHNNPTVNESEIIIFLRHVWWSAGKNDDFEKGRRKTKMRERRGTVSVKISETGLLYLFIHYFIKTNSILFSIKQINKIPFAL